MSNIRVQIVEPTDPGIVALSDADHALTAVTGTAHYSVTPTANRVVTLPASGNTAGDLVSLTRLGGGSATIAFKTGSTTLVTLEPDRHTAAAAEWTGSAWQLQGLRMGELPSDGSLRIGTLKATTPPVVKMTFGASFSGAPSLSLLGFNLALPTTIGEHVEVRSADGEFMVTKLASGDYRVDCAGALANDPDFGALSLKIQRES